MKISWHYEQNTLMSKIKRKDELHLKAKLNIAFSINQHFFLVDKYKNKIIFIWRKIVEQFKVNLRKGSDLEFRVHWQSRCNTASGAPLKPVPLGFG